MKMRALAILAVVALVAACSSDTNDTTTEAAGNEASTTTEATSSDSSTTTTPADSSGEVHTAETDLGTILVDADGFTLYIFTLDSDGESTCYDQCAATWPPVSAGMGIGGDLDESIFGSTTRTDGSEQLTVSGKPLYTFTPDASPGDINGQGVNDVWFVVDETGAVVGP